MTSCRCPVEDPGGRGGASLLVVSLLFNGGLETVPAGGWVVSQEVVDEGGACDEACEGA
jgi:hypothetical protein